MKSFITKSLLAGAITLTMASQAFAITVNDAKGKFTINTTPKKVVVLELAYVDALSQIGVSPIGVADDKDKTRVLPQVRSKLSDWTSVGTRAQPSLEVISTLKPDLIIADLDRNNAIYNDLKKIAPTLILNARHGTYQEDLKNAQVIADVLGKSEQMKKRIATHKATMQKYAQSLGIPKGTKAVYGNSRENEFNLGTRDFYTGGVLSALGFNLPAKAPADKDPIPTVGLERIAKHQPQWMFIAHYRDESIAKKWADQALWKAIPAVKKGQVVSVGDGDIWARAKGMEAAEQIAKEVQQAVKK